MPNQKKLTTDTHSGMIITSEYHIIKSWLRKQTYGDFKKEPETTQKWC